MPPLPPCSPLTSASSLTPQQVADLSETGLQAAAYVRTGFLSQRETGFRAGDDLALLASGAGARTLTDWLAADAVLSRILGGDTDREASPYGALLAVAAYRHRDPGRVVGILRAAPNWKVACRDRHATSHRPPKPTVPGKPPAAPSA